MNIGRALAEGLCEEGYMSLHDFLHLFGTPEPQFIEWTRDGAVFFDPPVGVRESAYLMGLDPPKYSVPMLCEANNYPPMWNHWFINTDDLDTADYFTAYTRNNYAEFGVHIDE